MGLIEIVLFTIIFIILAIHSLSLIQAVKISENFYKIIEQLCKELNDLTGKKEG